MSRSIAARSARLDEGSDTAGYFSDSKRALTSLVFLLPLIIAYEIGTRQFTTAAQHGHDQQIIAFTMMRQAFRLIGVHAQHLPAVAVVLWLLCIHIFEHAPWQFHPSTLLGMAAECVIWALPLIGAGWLMSRYFPLATLPPTNRDLVIMSLGAGVYEELVFRLILFNVLGFLLHDLLRLPLLLTYLGVVLFSALTFSLYHYLSPAEHFAWRTFAFRTVAGAYFGVLFLVRGFGISASCHAAYDVLILCL
jgi:hypothetical protein